MDRTIDLAREQWAEGHRRLARARVDEPELYERLHRQIEIVIDGLRRRVGGSYTLAELARAYGGAERWVLETIESEGSGQRWLSSVSTSADAAFYLYARGARDYRP